MKVLIADDHPLVRDALARTLRLVVPDVEVVEAGDYASAENQLAAHGADLALLDLHMPGMEPVQGLQRLRALFPAVPLAVASGDDDPAVMRATLAAGAVAFLPKSAAPELLQQALRTVLGGGSYLPRQALEGWPPASPASPSARPQASALTPRQKDVLRCLLQGRPNKLIARELGLTEGTVKIHIAAILRALQARNRTEAVVVAQSMGLAG